MYLIYMINMIYDISYILCYPDENSLDIYRKRYEERGNNQEYIDKVINTFDIRKKQFEDRQAKTIILSGNETLEDYLLKSVFNLIEK